MAVIIVGSVKEEDYAEENLSTEEAKAKADSRLLGASIDQGGSERSQATSQEGPQAAECREARIQEA